MFDMSYEAKYHQLVSREITPRKNNKRWGYIALIAFGLSIALFTYLGTKNAHNSLAPNKTEALVFRYFDKDKKCSIMIIIF